MTFQYSKWPNVARIWMWMTAGDDDGQQTTISMISDSGHINNSLFAKVNPPNKHAIIVESRTDINISIVRSAHEEYTSCLSLLLLTFGMRWPYDSNRASTDIRHKYRDPPDWPAGSCVYQCVAASLPHRKMKENKSYAFCEIYGILVRSTVYCAHWVESNRHHRTIIIIIIIT